MSLSLEIGFNKLPITMDRRHAKEVVLGTRDVDHFLGENFIRQLPELLSNPVAIIESTSRPTDSIVIITNYKNPNTNQTALVPISISAIGRHMNLNIDANNITSSYSKSVPARINDKTAESMLVDAVKKELVSPGSVYYLDTKISSQVLQSAGVQFSGKMQLGSSIHNIHDPITNVNIKKINQTDTRQFGRWFRASKIRNKDNTAMVVYHGTPNDFTVFDKNAKHLHDAGDYGEGFYFTPDATEAQYMYAIGKIPKYCTDRFDIGQLDITISPRHTYNNIVTAEESKAEGNYRKGEHDHYHGLGVEGFVEAIDAIKNPIEIYDGIGSKKGANPRIVSLINTKKSGTLLAVIEFYKDEQVYNGDGRRTHALLTIYEKDNLHDYINAIQKNNKVLDINNEQSHSNNNRPIREQLERNCSQAKCSTVQSICQQVENK